MMYNEIVGPGSTRRYDCLPLQKGGEEMRRPDFLLTDGAKWRKRKVGKG
jgi:hypothetical protein